MSIIAVTNQKGGVGKTTTTLNLGAALQEVGKRVLLVDLDPQGNLSVAAGLLDAEELSPTIGDLLTAAARGKRPDPEVVLSAIRAAPSGLDVLPANAALATAELSMVSAFNREAALANVLRPVVERYDYLLIDCLPSLGLLAINALRAADGLLIPVQADFLAMQGLGQIFETVAAVREQLNPSLAIYGVLLTLVDQRTAHAREVVRTVRTSLAGQVTVFDTEIRLHVALKQTAQAGRSILEYDSASQSAEAYRALAREVLRVVGDYAASAPLPASPAADDGPERDAHALAHELVGLKESDRKEQPSPQAAGPAAATPGAPPAAAPRAVPRAVPAPAPVVAPAAAAASATTPAASAAVAPAAASAVAVPAPAAEDGGPPQGAAPEPPPAVNGHRFDEFLQGRERWLGSGSP